MARKASWGQGGQDRWTSPYPWSGFSDKLACFRLAQSPGVWAGPVRMPGLLCASATASWKSIERKDERVTSRRRIAAIISQCPQHQIITLCT